ncbi:MAG TPA: hypothetical protein VH741_04025 [Candidatus Limnocylindrales bacterium]
MTDETPAAPQAHHEPADSHQPADHERDMEGIGGHVDEHMAGEHGHAEERLGPIDWESWLYAALGVVAGLVVVLGFWLAIT